MTDADVRRAPAGRQGVRWLAALSLLVAVAACGKKGPPLAPFQRVPGQADGVTAERVGDEIVVSFTVPSSNVDRRAPADLERVEVFAISSLRPPETEEQRKLATLVATLPIRPVLPPDVIAAAAAPNAPPLPPGFDQGGKATFRETLTPGLHALVEYPAPKNARPRPVIASDELPIAPLVAPPPTDEGRRYYFVVGVSPRGRKGRPSGVVAVPFGQTSGTPSAPVVTYTATEMSITWTPPADARTSTLPAVRPPKPPTPVALPLAAEPVAGAGAAPGAPLPPGATPPAPGATSGQNPAAPARPGAPGRSGPPLPPPLLAARSRGFTVQGTTYHVYENVATHPAPDTPPDPTLPKRLSPQPLLDPEYTVKGVVFGVERCFAVRAVDQLGGSAVQGPASPATCVTPVDTFAPAAPQSLAAIGGQGVINLIWERNAEADVAGYLVLRADAPDGTLQPLMTTPVQETTYADRTARPGVRYVYAVVAVDTATVPNMSPQSNRVEETARQ